MPVATATTTSAPKRTRPRNRPNRRKPRGPPPGQRPATVEGEGGPSTPVFKRVTEDKPAEHPNNAVRQIMNEMKEFNRNTFAEEQIQLEFQDDEDPFKLVLTLTPNDGLYKDAYFKVLITLTEEYPTTHPKLSALSPIFHPNISYEGAICFSLLNETVSHLRLTDYAHGMLWLLYYPNLFSVLNSDCTRNGDQYAKLVRTSIEGGKVAGKYYQRSKVLKERDQVKKNEKKEEKEEKAEKAEEEEKEEGKEGEKKEKEEEKQKEKKWEWHLIGEEWVQFFEDDFDKIAQLKADAEEALRIAEEAYYNACFAGQNRALMEDGTLRRLDTLQRGDRVATGPNTPAATIQLVVRTQIADETPSLVHLPGGLMATETHPVRLAPQEGPWTFPREHARARPTPGVPHIFSFILEERGQEGQGAGMVIEGVECIGMGHGVTGDEVAEHPFFGTERVVEELERARGWEQGRVTLEEGAWRRNRETGMLDGLVVEREIIEE